VQRDNIGMASEALIQSQLSANRGKSAFGTLDYIDDSNVTANPITFMNYFHGSIADDDLRFLDLFGIND